MKFATRDGSISPREGLRHAFDLFREGYPSEAAMVFLAYGDLDNDIGIVTESEHSALAAHLKQVCAYAALFNMICEEQVVPSLTGENEPGYRSCPWTEI
jgi:hypothetical protein